MLIVSKKRTNFKNFFLLFTLFEMKSKKKKKDFFNLLSTTLSQL